MILAWFGPNPNERTMKCKVCGYKFRVGGIRTWDYDNLKWEYCKAVECPKCESEVELKK